jgi:hypothetical protein
MKVLGFEIEPEHVGKKRAQTGGDITRRFDSQVSRSSQMLSDMDLLSCIRLVHLFVPGLIWGGAMCNWRTILPHLVSLFFSI